MAEDEQSAVSADGERRRGFAARRQAWRRRALGLVCVFLGAALSLGALAPIRPQAIAPGALTTEATVVMLRDFAGGDVAEIFVAPGETVAAGAPLLRLDGEAAAAEITRLETRSAHLRLRRDRHAALLHGGVFAPQPSPALRDSHFVEARRQLEAERAELAHEAASMAAEIAETRAEALSTTALIKRLETLAASHREQHAMAAKLAEDGVGSRRAALEEAGELAEAEARLAEAEGRAGALASAILRLESASARETARRQAAWSAEIAEAETELADLDTRLADAKARAARLLATAPIAGRVLELGAATAGDAIAPGGLLASIVPAAPGERPALVAEIRIAPKDVGHVSEGAPVRIEVSAFDRTLFGEIEGALRSISPSTLFDAEGRPYYRGEVALTRTQAALGDMTLDLAPGMTVEARIALGERSLLGYLMKPISRSLDAAFRER